ncbi:hypothetical protein [Phaeocystidibacter marisrubri]|uniref:Uncharacterized protein n=1 Tax=Phaeocystidibacter marisrubri TaxID=1577780 RepID=A0A6L3ZGU2_9FLAO|nr:hypothetical protein [Phaeocystidibacter marisrubri]KAB2816544.1 hypothetical protein F8C82_12750 [Phaeocystidibacter marisrubri]GGH69591.1 hypothetical protein GCM10011318_10760 [Phaeocystidibacter marisrubri]
MKKLFTYITLLASALSFGQTRIDVGVINFMESPSGTVHFDITLECTRSDTAFIAFSDLVFTFDWSQFTNPMVSVSSNRYVHSRTGNTSISPGFIRFGSQNNANKVIYTMNPQFIDSQSQFNDNVIALDNGVVYSSVHVEITGYTGIADPAFSWVTSGARNESISNMYCFTTRQPKFVSSAAEMRFSDFPSLGSPRLDLTVFLEGAFNSATGEMNTTLNTNGLIPLSNPYSGAPWNYAGGESVTTIPNADVVDWVLVEIRETYLVSNAAASSSLAKRAGFLLKDGTIVDLDGSSYLEFDNTEFNPNKKQFVVVYHRNHLAVMSADSLTYNDSLPPIARWEYDFSTGASAMYGGVTGAKVKSGVSMMMAGDADGTGQISASDKNSYWQPANGNLNIYSNADFNMDGQISASDANMMWRTNNGRITATP